MEGKRGPHDEDRFLWVDTFDIYIYVEGSGC